MGKLDPHGPVPWVSQGRQVGVLSFSCAPRVNRFIRQYKMGRCGRPVKAGLYFWGSKKEKFVILKALDTLFNQSCFYLAKLQLIKSVTCL